MVSRGVRGILSFGNTRIKSKCIYYLYFLYKINNQKEKSKKLKLALKNKTKKITFMSSAMPCQGNIGQKLQITPYL